MSRRTTIILWTSVAATVLLLGGTIGTARRVLAGGGISDDALLALTLIGLVGSLLVAGRIVFVSAAVRHRPRRR